MAVTASARGAGLGAQLLEACLAHAQGHGGDSLWCSSRRRTVTYYARFGFVAVGEEYFLPEFGNEPYLTLRKRLR